MYYIPFIPDPSLSAFSHLSQPVFCMAQLETQYEITKPKLRLDDSKQLLQY